MRQGWINNDTTLGMKFTLQGFPMQRALRCFRGIDFVVAVGSLGWGLRRFGELGTHEWLTSMVWTGSGILGLFFVWWNPTAKLQAFIEKRFVRPGRNLPPEPGPYPEPPRGEYRPKGRSNA